MLSVLAATFVALSASAAASQIAPVGAPQTVVYGAWETQCMPSTPPQAGASTCRVASSITVPVADGQRAVAAVVLVQGAPQAGGVQLVVQLPNSVWLPSGVRLETAAGELVAQLPFMVCGAQACEAGVALTQDQWRQVSGSPVSLSLRYDLQGGNGAKLDFSMDGFTAATTAVGLPRP